MKLIIGLIEFEKYEARVQCILDVLDIENVEQGEALGESIATKNDHDYLIPETYEGDVDYSECAHQIHMIQKLTK